MISPISTGTRRRHTFNSLVLFNVAESGKDDDGDVLHQGITFKEAKKIEPR